MPGFISSKSAIVVGGAAAIAVGALSMALVMGPASADDPNAAPSVSAQADTRFGDSDGDGPGRDHGHGPMDQAISGIGQVLLKTDTYKATDGTVTVIRRQHGQVTAVSASSVSLKTSSIERTYAIDSSTDVMGGTVGDIAVGDQIAVEATIDGDTATAAEIHAHFAPPTDGPRGPRNAHADYGVEIAEQLLVEKADGTVVTINETRGTVVSVDGSSISLRDASGATVTFTVPSSVTPERNRLAAALSDFVAGDDVHVLVEQDASASTVIAVHGHDSSVMGPDGGPDGHRRHHGHGGPHGHGPDGDGDGMPHGAPLPKGNPNNA